VQAYTPEFSKALAEALLSHSEAFVNEASQNIARREMQFALDEITRSQKMLKAAKQALLAFQNTHNLVSPDSEGESLFTIVAELEGELAQTEAAISQGESYLNADAPQVMVMRSKAKALSKEIAAQKQRITGAAESGEKLNELSAQFQSLAVDLELAKTLYGSALNAYEMSRVQAGKQLKHLIVASSPQLAEEAVLPKRGYWFATWLLFLFVGWGICRLVIASSREHKD
jgi:capsular polysaccharide transport system permease protein